MQLLTFPTNYHTIAWYDEVGILTVHVLHLLNATILNLILKSPVG